jgi:PAS domain S-box-containing protein
MASRNDGLTSAPPVETDGPDPRHALDYVPDCVLVLDPQFRCTYLNHAALQLAGKSAEELTGESIRDALPELADTVFQKELSSASDERRHRHFEEYSARTNRWLAFDVYPDCDGLIVIGRDVTNDRAAAIENRLRDERLSLALSFGKMGVWEYDVAKDLVRWSSELEAIHGLSPGAFDGKHETVVSLVHPDDLAGMHQAYSLATRNGASWPTSFASFGRTAPFITCTREARWCGMVTEGHCSCWASRSKLPITKPRLANCSATWSNSNCSN